MAHDRGKGDDDAEGDQHHPRPKGKTGGLGREMGCACTHLAKKQPETADGKTNPHQAEPSADPGEEGSFRRKVHSRIFFCWRFQAGMVSVAKNIQTCGIPRLWQLVCAKARSFSCLPHADASRKHS